VEKKIQDNNDVIVSMTVDEAKARVNATARVQKLITTIHADPELQTELGEIYISIPAKMTSSVDDGYYAPKIKSIREAFWSIDAEIPKMLVDKLLPEEIAAENAAFIDKINSMETYLNAVQQ
jgi:hypothetical protein